MLNIDVNVNIKKTTYPIIFTNNTCTQCGATDSLKFVDVFGRQTTQEIHALERIQCIKCGAKYGIEWKSSGNGNLDPIPTDYDVAVMFRNLINHKYIKNNGNKKL